MRRIDFDQMGDGSYWATEVLKNLKAEGIMRQSDIGVLQAASKLESSKDYRILFYSVVNGSPRGVMLNATIGAILDRETIQRFFKRFKPEYGNELHYELAKSLEYLNIFHDLEFSN